jgi:E3 ubiquitin-protein ligase DOA10
MNDRALLATNNLIRQQYLFFKVTSFMLLERLILPVIYGILVDVATWPLTGDVASVRWDFAGSHPSWCCFLYWFVGKCLVAYYAALVRLCSETVRPGAMMFICRFPRLHSVHEIMEHSPSLLLWELCAGTLVYMVVIGFNVGTVAWVTGQVTDQNPLQWLLE